MIIVVMGVSGSGKSTIAKTLARKLHIEYADADSFHSAANVAKMSKGEPLTDADRIPWLESLRSAIETWIKEGRNVTLACSALKNSYRDILNVDAKIVRFAFLKGSYSLFASRLEKRTTHFMKTTMLKSQFEALEEPDENDATICDAGQSVMDIVSQIISANFDSISSAH